MGRKREVQVGDQVLIAHEKTATRQPFDPRPYDATKVTHDQVTAKKTSTQRTRNIGKCKVLKKKSAIKGQ